LIPNHLAFGPFFASARLRAATGDSADGTDLFSTQLSTGWFVDIKLK
jgi:hypothetical protein